MLGLTTIGAIDFGRAARAKRRKERDRLRKAKQRRDRGKPTRKQYEEQSISRTKPWLDEGISRASWYRRQRGVRQVRLQHNIYNSCRSTCLIKQRCPRIQWAPCWQTAPASRPLQRSLRSRMNTVPLTRPASSGWWRGLLEARCARKEESDRGDTMGDQ